MVWLLLFILSVTPVQQTALTETGSDPADPREILQRGLEAETTGNYEKALEIWLQAKPRLAVPSLAIARNYLRVATEQKLSNYYNAASALYQWGLSGKEIEPNREALEAELAFLDPLLEKETRRRWEEMLGTGDPELLNQMQYWWEEKDPAPGTAVNERLIEHWQRIAYARKHFTRNDNTAYGTDDRGTAWVAYGPPERTFTERLHLTLAEAQRIASKFGGKSSTELIARGALDLHEEPEVHIWVYLNGISDRKENLVLMYGPKNGVNFGELKVVEDLIPRRGFTLSKRYEHINLRMAQAGGNAIADDVKINPGMVLQWAYYRQLSTKDFYFSSIFEEMAFDWDRVDKRNFSKSYGQRYRGKHAHQKTVILSEAPEEMSTLEKDFPSIPLEPYHYKLLNEQNQPVFATFLVSRPQRAFLEDLAVNQDSMAALDVPDSLRVRQAFSHYRLIHGVELRTETEGKIGGDRHSALLRVNGDDMQTPSSSGFMIPYRDDLTQTFYAELHNTHPSAQSTIAKNRPDIDAPFPKRIRGIGKVTAGLPEPMEATPGNLQLGELIFGWNMEANPGGLVPFRVAHGGEVPEGERLALHFEAYNLRPGDTGQYEFSLTYEILPVNNLGWTQERKDRMSVTLYVEHDGPQYREDLEIQAADLEPGRYVLRVRAHDSNSDNEAYREVEFKVVEREN